MARRVSWTNNSSGHLGTHIYRAPTLDPQNLPAPVATVDPVAQGATAEWVDTEAPYECYAVQDFDGQGVSALSGEVCVTDPWAGVQIGDAIGGGIYAGTLDIGGTNYHIIAANQSGESVATQYKTSQTSTVGADNTSDGLANTQAIIAGGISAHPAAEHCVNYSGGGFNDWYLPSRTELGAIYSRLASAGHPEFSTKAGDLRWTSTESSSQRAWSRRFTGDELDLTKNTLAPYARPVRRVTA